MEHGNHHRHPNMKFIFSILALFGLLCLEASAQFSGGLTPTVNGALVTNSVALTGGGVYCMVGGTAAPGPSTNIPVAHARSVPLGSQGFGITVNMSGTNSVTTTNATLQFQFSGDGINWATNNLLSINLAPPGTNYFPCYTNIPNTTVAVGNAQYLRLYSFHHTNLGSIFVTNINISTR